MINLNTICDNVGARVKFKRVGRGVGSDKGKTCGKGMKGQKSRSGVSLHNFAGGQMPLYRRFAHIGFNNAKFKKNYAVVNLFSIQKAIDNGILDKNVNIDTLKNAGLISKKCVVDGLKILGFGKLNTAVTVEVDKISNSAKDMIEKAGGSVVIKEIAVNTDSRGRFAKSNTAS